MKQKLFTLLTLLLTVCSGAWAEDVQVTLFHWAYDNTSSVNTITNGTALTGVTGGALTPGTTNDSKAFSAKDKISSYGTSVPNDMKAAGTAGSNAYYLKNGSAALSLKVELETGNFQAGDIVQICATGNWNVSTTNNKGGNDGDVITKIATGSTSAFNFATATIPEGFTASNTLYFARQDGTTCGICAIKIVRNKSVSVVSKELTGIKINGTSWDVNGLSENAATISDECAGPPTVQFIYKINYDDNTSETGKTENIEAIKNGTNYVATSTVLTNNVTLTFTNVSNTLFSMTDITGPTSDMATKTSSDVTATFSPGCSAVVYNGKGGTAKMVTNGSINLGGSDNSYFKANLTSKLAAGDVISCSNTTGSFYIWYSDSKTNEQTMPYTIPANSDLIGKKAIYIKKKGQSTFSWLTITRPKTIDSQELGGVKKGETTLTASTDYTVSGTTITLTDAYKSVLAPTDVKLINHITYDDATTEDEDVDVTLTKNGDFFEGTAAIGTTTYTVKVPVDTTTPLLTLSAASGSINLNSYTPTGTAKVTLTGVNLTNGTFSAPTADGVTVTPATVEITDGTLSQEFTITSTATTAASTVLSFAYTGAETQTYTLSYEKTAKRVLTQTEVTGATTWDWTKSGGASIELKEDTDPANGAEFLLAALPEITNDDTFNSQALLVACQWPNRGNSYYFQGNSVKFNTTVPGILDVTFSNTGGSRPYRYLRVNGTQTSFKSGDSNNMVEATGIAVPAGEVVIDFYIPDATDPQERSGDVVGTTMCRINKIVFTPATANVTVASTGFTTYVNSTYALNFEGTGITPYVIKANNAESVTLEAKTSVAAGEPVLLYAEGGATKDVPAIATATAENGNLLVPGEGDRITYTDATPYYVLSTEGGVTGFYRANNTLVPTGKAYLNAGTAGARFFALSLDGETTGIGAALIDNGQLTIDNAVYNLNGQRVMNPAKGLYIVNGRKVVVK